jgi:hypothetical protein
MLKPSFLIAAAVLSASAHAESTFREFSYTGLFHEEAGQFLPNVKVGGNFYSDDLNGNGIVERSEVSSFVLNGQQYVGDCGAEVFLCGLFEFSYTPGGALMFETAWTTNPWDEAGVAGGEAYSGVEFKEYSYWLGVPASTTLRWTAQTVFSISPVPEPASYGMLALGLGIVALRSRRRLRAGRETID